ncbi:MAG: hypothetical protein KGK16_13325 [Bradyrhizobium sp.]|nr:hypothetical protein [Bradyrhizobium sp.]
MTEFNNEVRELTDAELDAVNGGSILSAIGHALSWVGHKIVDGLHGPGDLRRGTDRPN